MAGINITLGGNFAALNQLQAKVSETVTKIRTGFSERIGHRMFDGLMATAARMPELIGRSIDAASVFQETVSKVGVVFDESAESILAWSEASAKAFGQSRSEALAAAADYGNLFRAMGITTGRSAEMSKSLVELAADLASFNNTSVPDAIQAIGAALRGEAEPIRRYGVLLDDATLKAAAMAKGLYNGKGSLEPATRALAAYNVVLEQTSTAQGDFARTADGLANSQRTLRAEIENMLSATGDGLLPAMQGVTSAAKELDGVAIGTQMGDWARETAVLFQKLLELTDAFAQSPQWTKMTGGFSKDVADGWKSVFDVARQSASQSRNNASLQEFNATAFAKDAASREEIAKKLVELEAAKAMLTEVIGSSMDAARPEVAEAMAADLDATLNLLDGQAAKIRAITDAQLEANQAKREAAAAEAAYSQALEESGKKYEAAKSSFDKAVARADQKRIDALPIKDQIAELEAAENRLREKLAQETHYPDGSGKLIADQIAAERKSGYEAIGQDDALKIATQLMEMEEKRAALLREQEKVQAEANKEREKAVADYDAELAMIRAKVDGNQQLVAQLEREAEMRQRIADLVAAGVDPAEAQRRAQAMDAAQEELRLAERKRENAKAMAEAEALARGGPEKRIASNEDFLDRMRDLRGGVDSLTYQSTLTADSMQRIGGGGGFAGTDASLDYQRRQTDYLREMATTLRDMREFQSKVPLD